MLCQFAVGHSRGSSHGGSRITRKAYDKPYYVKMMNEAFELWAEIEKQSQKQLYKYVSKEFATLFVYYNKKWAP